MKRRDLSAVPQRGGISHSFIQGLAACPCASKVDIVGWSQGGMMPRYYINNLGGAAKVNILVGLAPSNFGTNPHGLQRFIDGAGLARLVTAEPKRQDGHAPGRSVGAPPGVCPIDSPIAPARPARHRTRSKPMSAYLFTFRAPGDYASSGDTFDAWATWQVKLGARLKDRGNVAFAAVAIGASATDTTLGGYSLIRATSLDAAADLARGCPILRHGGAVEVGELTNHDDRFDEWLTKNLSS
jgi:hypothetical protein